jgi:hypothetical protein
VAELEEAQVLQAGSLACLVEAHAQVAGVYRAVVHVDEDKVRFTGPVAATGQRVEHLGSAVGERDRADLAALGDPLDAVLGDVAADVDGGLGEVDAG